MASAGRPKAIEEQHFPVLRSVVAESPGATLAELGAAFSARTGICVSRRTLAKALVESGCRKIDNQGPDKDSSSSPAAVPDATRYGYTEQHRAAGDFQRYPSSLSDNEWALVADLFDFTGKRGKPPTSDRRLMLDACCYVVRTGCSWRQLPRDFPPWQNVYRTFRRWSEAGLFEAMNDRLREMWRQQVGREVKPTAAVIDAQSTRGSPQGGDLGYDAGKKVKGRKRHILCDTLGLILAVCVSAASVQDRDGAHPVMAAMMSKYDTVDVVFADSAYGGVCAQTIKCTHSVEVEVVRHPGRPGSWVAPGQGELFERDASQFKVLPKRWVVERTHAWLERSRRLMIHHDRLPSVAESWVWLASARQLVSRLG